MIYSVVCQRYKLKLHFLGKDVIVLDHSETETVKKADIVLSAASFAEGDGTVVSQEGRAQRFYQVYDPSYYKPELAIKESWRWLHAH